MIIHHVIYLFSSVERAVFIITNINNQTLGFPSLLTEAAPIQKYFGSQAIEREREQMRKKEVKIEREKEKSRQ